MTISRTFFFAKSAAFGTARPVASSHVESAGAIGFTGVPPMLMIPRRADVGSGGAPAGRRRPDASSLFAAPRTSWRNRAAESPSQRPRIRPSTFRPDGGKYLLPRRFAFFIFGPPRPNSRR